MITSLSNGRIKNVMQLLKQGKQRRKQGLFVIEGARIVSETPEHLLRELYVSKSFASKHENKETIEMYQKLFGTGKLTVYEVVSDEVFAKMCDTVTPQGVLAVANMLVHDIDDILIEEKASYLILEDIQDPGNLGTMMRTAEGAGIRGVIMSKGTVDIYNPKTLRSTMGSIFRVPFCYVDDLGEVVKKMQKHGIVTYAAHLAGKQFYDEISFAHQSAVMIGNEGNGLSDKLSDLADVKLKIPMEGKLESLNAAVSAAILMYEMHRQKK